MKTFTIVLTLLVAIAGQSLAKPSKSELLSNVSKTRSEMSMTFARNARS